MPRDRMIDHKASYRSAYAQSQLLSRIAGNDLGMHMPSTDIPKAGRTAQISRRAGLGVLLLPFAATASRSKEASRGRSDSELQAAPSSTYTAAGPNAHRRLVSEKLDEFALSVMDFMTPDQAAAVRRRDGSVDCTDALNRAFEQARITGRTVYMPDGIYTVGNLIFGSQSVTGQSSSPMGLYGQSKIGTILRAQPGLTGTLLKSWSLAGVTFCDFTIETTGSAAQAWDCAWKAGAGPSTQNVIRNILVSGGSAKLHVDWNDLNDTYPTDVTVRVQDARATSCGISAVQSGGLAMLRGCIWSGCYLRFGAQNGKIDGCWGHGIEFAAGCLNHVEISAGYIYANPSHDGVLWSQSSNVQQSVRALICTATQFITVDSSVSAYFHLNACSMLKFSGCQWLGAAPRLLGSRCRSDSYATVLVKIEGGTHSGTLSVENVPGFDVECEGFVNDVTGRMVTKNRSGSFMPMIRGSGSKPGTYTKAPESYGRYVRSGNLVDFKLRISWSRHSAAGPRIQPLVTGLPLEPDAGGIDTVILEYAGGTFPGQMIRATLSGGTIAFFTMDGAPVALPPEGDLILSGRYSVKA